MTEHQLKALSDAVTSLDKVADCNTDGEEYIVRAAQLIGSLRGISPSSDKRSSYETEEILGVIADIVNDPYLIARCEEEIVLAANARSLSPRDFNSTVKDGALWRRQSGRMLPESVHSSHYIHVLENAENYFITRLIRLIYSELGEYMLLYSAAANGIESDGTLRENSTEFERAYSYISALYKRVRRLMNTDFYSRLSERCFNEEIPLSSNILCLETRYRKCFKFYRRRRICADQSEVRSQLTAYFSAIIASRLCARGFKPTFSPCDKKFTAVTAFSSPVRFVSGDFEVTYIACPDKGYARIEVYNPLFERSAFNPSVGVVFFEDGADIKRIAPRRAEGATTVAVISPWGYLRDGIFAAEGLQDERQIIDRYLSDRMTCIRAEKTIYSHLCPVCKGHSVTCSDDLYICSDCGAAYALSRGRMWIISKGKREGGNGIC